MEKTISYLMVEELLGAGSSSKVYRVHDPSAEVYALKVVEAPLVSAMPGLEAEVGILSRLSHPNLVKFLGIAPENCEIRGLESKGRGILLEWVKGTSPRGMPGKIKFSLAEDLFVQALRGLAYLHARQILHGDLKPDNLRVTPKGKLKILDFGLSQILSKNAYHGSDVVRGTLDYMAPETAAGSPGMTSDLFSLGIIFYEWLADKLPYASNGLHGKFVGPAKALKTLNPEVPEYFSKIISRMLELEPERRFKSASSVMRAINRAGGRPYSLQAPGMRKGTESALPFIGRRILRKKLRADLKRWLDGNSAGVFVIRGPIGIGKSRLVGEIKLQAALYGVSHRDWTGEEVSSKAFRAWEKGGPRELACIPDLSAYNPQQRCALAGVIEHFLGSPKGNGLILVAEDPATHEGPVDRLGHLMKVSEGIHEYVLAEFDLSETREFLEEWRLDQTVTEEEAVPYWRLSLGNPALLTHLAESYPRGLPQGGKISLPTKFQDFIRARWVDLSVPARQVLIALSVAHASFSISDLALALRLPKALISELAVELSRQGWIARKEDSLSLATSMYRGSFLKSASMEERRATAAAILDWLQGHSPDNRLSIAVFAEAAGRWEKFWSEGYEAAIQLEDQDKPEEALDLFQRVVASRPPKELEAKCQAYVASSLSRMGRYSLAEKAYDRWYRLSRNLGNPTIELKYRYLLGLNFFNQGMDQKAKRALESVVRIGCPEDFSDARTYLIKTHSLLGILEERAGHLETALQSFHRGLKLATSDSEELAQLLRFLGSHWEKRGDAERGAEFLSRSMELSRKIAYREGILSAAWALAELAQKRGRHEEALASYRTVLELAEEVGDFLKVARTRSNMAALFLEKAEYAQATEALRLAGAYLVKFGTHDDRLIHRFHELTLEAYVGSLRSEMAEEFAKSLEEPGREFLQGHFARLRGEFLRLRRDFQGALQFFRKSSELLEAQKQEEEASVSRLYQALVQCAVGDPAEARRLLGIVGALDASACGALVAWLREFLQDNPPESAYSSERIVFLSQLPQRELGLQALLAASESLFRKGRTEDAERWKAGAAEVVREIYGALPEDCRIAFENRMDFDRLGAEDIRRLQSGAISSERFLSYTQINKRLSQETDMTSILEKVMDSAMALAGAERGFLLLEDSTQSKSAVPGFRVESARNLKKDNLFREEFRISLSVLRESVRRGGYILTDDAQADPEFSGSVSVHRYGFKSILALPLMGMDRCFGAIYLDHPYQIGAFSHEKLLFLLAFADQAALAIQKARAMAKIYRDKEALQTAVIAQANYLEKMEAELEAARQSLHFRYEEIVGRSPKMIEILRLIDKITDSKISVWIQGETGTGKELIARALHYNSFRRDKPFITENCSAIPENLLESVLFGHVKGAFTHADRDRMGLFEAADGGTIFLDEIGDMPLNMQAKLLRVLQEGEVRRVGSHKSVKVDVRVVSASNKNLPGMARAGTFREDLLYRLNGIRIALPPLRERKEDIPYLIRHFLEKIASEEHREPLRIEEMASRLLISYGWPGNIRELENALHNAVLFAENGIITARNLQFMPELFQSRDPALVEAAPQGALRKIGGHGMRGDILNALVKGAFKKEKAAAHLGITVRHLYNLLEKYDLPKNKWELKRLVEEERGS